MNFKNKKIIKFLLLLAVVFCTLCSQSGYAYEIFIYRPYLKKDSVSKEKKITLHGEFFGHLQLPSTFPSYNDLSGDEDRWNYGFQNIIFITENTSFLAQLVTHDNGHKRTKFDWHFSLRHLLFDNFAIIIGHDSNHDSDNLSKLYEKNFYLNRNYVGFGLPFESNNFYIEPFTWFFHHTNHRGHLDYSGEKLCQEYGLRIGLLLKERLSLNLQVISQSEDYFSLGQAFIVDLIIRFRVLDYLELSSGAGLWKDIQKSRLGNQKNFYKLIWGIAIPF